MATLPTSLTSPLPVASTPFFDTSGGTVVVVIVIVVLMAAGLTVLFRNRRK